MMVDYTVQCNDGKHGPYVALAFAMLFLISFGVPAAFAVELFINRKSLYVDKPDGPIQSNGEVDESIIWDASAQKWVQPQEEAEAVLGFLYGSYDPPFFWYPPPPRSPRRCRAASRTSVGGFGCAGGSCTSC